MSILTPHLGPYNWTDANNNPRPNAGSDEALKRRKLWLKDRAEFLNTSEGKLWLERHNFTKTKHEDSVWLAENGKI